MPEEQVVLLKPEELYAEPGFKEMVDAGVFYGRKKSKTNPKMKSYILTNRNGIEIVSLGKTMDVLEKATEFLREKARGNSIILFVATQPGADSVITLATEFGYPIVTRRWLGGTLTNFKIISKRIEYFKKLKADWGTSAFDKYTKKERVVIEKEMKHMGEFMGGLESLTERPAAMVIIDPNVHMSAVREAKLLKIPVIAFANTDSDPDLVEFPVVGNNKARLSITWFADRMRSAIEEGKKLGPEKPVVALVNEKEKPKAEAKK